MRKLTELIRERAKLDQELEEFKHLLTIQLVDIVACSELYRRMDLLTAAVVVERELNRIKAKVIHFGGLPIKTIGDALLSRFEDPVAGVRSAVDIQRWLAGRKNGGGYHIRVRIVLNRDVGLLEGAKIYGDVINLAAHIEKVAAPDTILITRSVYDAVRRERGIALRKATTAEGVELFEVIWRPGRRKHRP